MYYRERLFEFMLTDYTCGILIKSKSTYDFKENSVRGEKYSVTG